MSQEEKDNLSEQEDMLDDIKDDEIEIEAVNEDGTRIEAPQTEPQKEPAEDYKDKYLRLYADFDNYRKRMAKDKEDLVRYANENLIYEFLPSLDNLEIALKHVDADSKDPLAEGVRMTLREIRRTLEKFGLKRVEAEGKPFDPEFHHAISRVEHGDMDENMVVQEMRAGYVYNDKVLRAAMVSVSKKPVSPAEEGDN